MREVLIEGYAVDLARKKGWFVRKLAWVGVDGAPDRFFAKDGKIILIEFKKKNKGLRASQEWEKRELEKAGVEVFLVDTKEKADALFK